MGDEDKESHHGQIIQIKQKDRLFIIQKDKVRLQKHIGQEIPVNKLIESPVYADYMQQPSKRRAAADIQEIKHMARQQNPADHQPEHRQEQKQADCKLKAARGCIFPFE